MGTNATTPNDAFSDYVTRLFEEFVPALEVIFARRLPRDKKEEITQKMELLKSASLEFADKAEAIKESGDMAKFAEISNEYICAIIPEVNSSVSGLEYCSSSAIMGHERGL